MSARSKADIKGRPFREWDWGYEGDIDKMLRPLFEHGAKEVIVEMINELNGEGPLGKNGGHLLEDLTVYHTLLSGRVEFAIDLAATTLRSVKEVDLDGWGEDGIVAARTKANALRKLADEIDALIAEAKT